MNPYRENATPSARPLTRWQKIGLWFCSKGWHVVEEEILRGGDGPDDAAARLLCLRCGAKGWRWCGGAWDGPSCTWDNE
jgi:hypothetical protein